jgi:hypothetical protein
MRAIRIAISDPPTGDIIHRFRNFGEDLYRELREECTVSLDEIDSSTTAFVVRDIHKRDLRRITKMITELLREHHFEATATVTSL